MQQIQHFHPELRHATLPTYFASYLFPLMFVVYEVYRVGYWIATYGFNFTMYKSMGYEYLLMLTVFGVQIVVETIFLLGAAASHHADLGHRLTNLALGIFCSFVVLAFDYMLQVAF